LAVQPEAFEILVASSNERGTRGTVQGAAFLGDAVECVVRAGDSTLITKLPSSAAPSVGETVMVRIASTTCMLLSS
jgi:hypothetical protein